MLLFFFYGCARRISTGDVESVQKIRVAAELLCRAGDPCADIVGAGVIENRNVLAVKALCFQNKRVNTEFCDTAIINPNKLNPEYYSALYYFIETLGPERLVEFPIACELALATAHIPLPSSIENFQKYAPNWRFIKLVEKLKTIENLPTIDYNDNKTFFDYANTVLLACEFETLDEAWVAAEEYAEMSDLTMAEEMKAAIRYKKKHPWMLSYPMCNEDDFFSVEFNRFEPYFTIMDDAISYNSDHVRSEELVVENHMQALAQQICGYPSRYCRDSFKLMCGFSYMGTNNCPHYLNGECDGYVDAEPQLPELILDEDSNIKSGCSFELLLKSHNIDIKDIEVGIMRLVTYDEITNAAKKHFSA